MKERNEYEHLIAAIDEALAAHAPGKVRLPEDTGSCQILEFKRRLPREEERPAASRGFGS